MPSSTKATYELVPRTEEGSFTLREFRLPAFQSPWHFHPEWELTCILNGRGTRFVGDSIVAYGPGDVVLIGPNLPHFWHSESGPAHSLVIQFRNDFLGTDFFGRPELKSIRALLDRSMLGSAFRGVVRDQVAAAMTAMLTADSLQRLLDLLALLKLLASSDERVSLSSPGFQPHLDAQSGERMRRVSEYALAHFTDQLRAKELAQIACLSLPAFCRWFKRATGHTVSSFLNELRVGHACKLLIETNEDVGRIACASGFASLSNFNRLFRQRQQMAPKAYRQLHRGPDGFGV